MSIRQGASNTNYTPQGGRLLDTGRLFESGCLLDHLRYALFAPSPSIVSAIYYLLLLFFFYFIIVNMFKNYLFCNLFPQLNGFVQEGRK